MTKPAASSGRRPAHSAPRSAARAPSWRTHDAEGPRRPRARRILCRDECRAATRITGPSGHRASTVEAVEDVREIFVRDAGTVVADAEPAIPDLDLDLRARLAPLRGVVQEI